MRCQGFLGRSVVLSLVLVFSLVLSTLGFSDSEANTYVFDSGRLSYQGPKISSRLSVVTIPVNLPVLAASCFVDDGEDSPSIEVEQGGSFSFPAGSDALNRKMYIARWNEEDKDDCGEGLPEGSVETVGTAIPDVFEIGTDGTGVYIQATSELTLTPEDTDVDYTIMVTDADHTVDNRQEIRFNFQIRVVEDFLPYHQGRSPWKAGRSDCKVGVPCTVPVSSQVSTWKNGNLPGVWSLQTFGTSHTYPSWLRINRETGVLFGTPDATISGLRLYHRYDDFDGDATAGNPQTSTLRVSNPRGVAFKQENGMDKTLPDAYIELTETAGQTQETTRTIDLSQHFADPDSEISYSIFPDDEMVVSVEVDSAGVLTLTGKSVGQTIVSITAVGADETHLTDPPELMDSFAVTVLAPGSIITLPATASIGDTLTANVMDPNGIAQDEDENDVINSYQWQSSSDSGVSWNDISGETRQILRITSTFAEMQVRVVATYKNNTSDTDDQTATSSAVTIGADQQTAPTSLTPTTQTSNTQTPSTHSPGTQPPDTQVTPRPSAPPNTQPPSSPGGGGTANLPLGGGGSGGSVPTGAPTVQPVGDQVQPSSVGFSDSVGTTHETNINRLAESGITRGCNPPTNSLFCPSRAVTRGEMATFMVRTFDLAGSDSDLFADDNGNTHESNINALAVAEITRGCNPPENTRYCPERPVTQAQMATFLARAMELAEGSGNFDDTNDSPHNNDINRIASAGITRGCNPPTNSRYCPDRAVTRGEMATFLIRAVDQQEG